MVRQEKLSWKVWPTRLPAAIEPPAISLWDSLSVSARRYPNKTALAFFDSRITYAELENAAARLAARLAALQIGVVTGCWWSCKTAPNLSSPIMRSLAPTRLSCPVNPMNRAEELRHYITDAQATIAITTGDLAGEVAAASNGKSRRIISSI